MQSIPREIAATATISCHPATCTQPYSCTNCTVVPGNEAAPFNRYSATQRLHSVNRPFCFSAVVAYLPIYHLQQTKSSWQTLGSNLVRTPLMNQCQKLFFATSDLLVGD
ncbi:unnamed protein product [Chondrus crispus]|uniref:Uncharacterized protein n=1 Tax=Chondrus crispus TaxID=2769 RepID=R7QML2_CHOCR|nr:unnamed protein product [Chondrus crispus]CDF38625.1 unnamed protein product [Chondrus crispus]|eukprot:XP_005718530.1 unnamed protein product [Chondrus crispus]